MNRSLFPEAVEVHQRDLTFESSQRIEDTKRTTRVETTTGVVSGFTVTVNGGDATKFDVAAGTGYAPNGEYLAGGPWFANVLSDNTLGVLNYVLLVYDEVQSLPEAHETDGTTRFTRATRQPRVVVLTDTQYNALPTSNAVLGNNAKDRSLILGIITATGAAITAGSIAKPTQFNRAFSISQPQNISGVTILNVSVNTSTGTGTLSYDSTMHQATWQAPGDGTPGSAVTFATSGQYTLTSSGGSSIGVSVVYPTLPLSPNTDVITITDIYTQSVPRFSSVDSQHRAMLGGGIPAINNPHGMTLDDLSPGAAGSLESHQSVMHANGIVRTSNPNVLLGTVVPDLGASPDTLTITNFAAGDAAYINGRRIETLAGPSTITFADGTVQAGTYGVYLSQDGLLYKQQITRFATDAGTGLASKIQILDVQGFPAGSINLTWSTGNYIYIGTLGAAYSNAIASTTADKMMRIYDDNLVSYIDVWVKASSAPMSDETESIAIFAKPDLRQSLPVCNVPWSGANDGILGYGYGAHNAPNGVHDTRLWGNLSEEQTRLDAGMISTSQFIQDVYGNGIVVGAQNIDPSLHTDPDTVAAYQYSFVHANTGNFPTCTVSGGIAYVGGRRFEVPLKILSTVDNEINFIYVDHAGELQVDSGAGMTIDEFTIARNGRPFALLTSFPVTSGTSGAITSYKRVINSIQNRISGVLGLNLARGASITPSSGSGLTITGGTPALSITTSGGGILVSATGSTNAINTSGNTSARALIASNNTATLPTVEIIQAGTALALAVTNNNNANAASIVTGDARALSLLNNSATSPTLNVSNVNGVAVTATGGSPEDVAVDLYGTINLDNSGQPLNADNWFNNITKRSIIKAAGTVVYAANQFSGLQLYNCTVSNIDIGNFKRFRIDFTNSQVFSTDEYQIDIFTSNFNTTYTWVPCINTRAVDHIIIAPRVQYIDTHAGNAYVKLAAWSVDAGDTGYAVGKWDTDDRFFFTITGNS